jgi:hypothetical protein
MADVTETTAAPEMIFGEVMDAHMAKEFAKIIHSEDSSSEATKVADDQAAQPVEAAESKPDEPEVVEPEKPEPKETAKARNARLVEEARTAENRELRERLAKLEGMIEASRKPQEVVPQAPVVDPDAPDPSKYPLGEIDARYLLDAARYTARKEIMSEREAQARAAQEATLAEAIKEANTKADALVGVGKAKYDDFEDVVVKGFQSGAWKMVPEIGDLILGSEHGADIVYALGSNPAEANRIASLPLAQQAAWFGRQEAMLEAKKPAAASPRGGSKAPEPLPIRARGFGGSTGDQPDTDAFRAFEARMRQQRQ